VDFVVDGWRPSAMAWFYIFIAGTIEAIWPFVLKSDAGASQWWAPLKGVIIAMPIMFLLAWAMRQLSAGSTYATFVGIGTAATAVIGISLFGESPNPNFALFFDEPTDRKRNQTIM
jgi:quaternary ammonium compound-resistance protein SugE